MIPKEAVEIRNLIRALPPKHSRGGEYPRGLRDRVMAYYRERHAQGFSLRAIGDEIGFSRETIRKWSYTYPAPAAIEAGTIGLAGDLGAHAREFAISAEMTKESPEEKNLKTFTARVEADRDTHRMSILSRHYAMGVWVGAGFDFDCALTAHTGALALFLAEREVREVAK